MPLMAKKFNNLIIHWSIVFVCFSCLKTSIAYLWFIVIVKGGENNETTMMDAFV